MLRKLLWFWAKLHKHCLLLSFKILRKLDYFLFNEILVLNRQEIVKHSSKLYFKSMLSLWFNLLLAILDLFVTSLI